MDTSYLRIFAIAAATGSLSAAARELGITPMSASRGLRALESETGSRLMQRSTRSLSLTPEGELFLPYAQAIIENEEQATALLNNEAAASGLLRVSAPVAFSRIVIAPLIPRLLADNPQMRVALDMSDRLPDLIASGTDLAIRIARLRDSSMIASKLADNPRMLVATPDYLNRHGRPERADDLTAHDCLALTGSPHWTFRTSAGERAIRINGRFSCSSIEGAYTCCLAGGGIARLSQWLVRPDLNAGRLVSITLSDAAPEPVSVWGVYPSKTLLPPKVRVFLAAIREAMAAGSEASG